MSQKRQPALKSDLVGRLAKISKPRSQLQPLYEAVSNSLYSLQQSGCVNPTISVSVERQTASLQFKDSQQVSSIKQISIKDNGEGFNEANLDSFCTIDSTHKHSVGGKGVGRFLWLKLFEKAEIDSVFLANSRLQHRSFDFINGKDCFNNWREETVASDAAISTTISLVNPKDPITLSAEDIGYSLLSHFLPTLLKLPHLTLTLSDTLEATPMDLMKCLSQGFSLDTKEDKYTLHGHDFFIRHGLVSSRILKQHSYVLCANNLPVVHLKPDKALRLPSIAIQSAKLTDEAYYIGYISSSYLDNRNNPERQSFDIAADNETLLRTAEPTTGDIQRKAIAFSKRFLVPHLKKYRKVNFKRAELYISQHPKYRHLLKAEPDKLKMLPSDLSDSDLDISLYKIDKQNETKERLRSIDVLTKIRRSKDSLDLGQVLTEMSSLLQNITQASQSKLAEYVVRRRITLQFLEDLLGAASNERYPLEDALHSLIFPMKTTSNEVRLDDTNLWIIDERYSYHRFLSSDKTAFKQASKVNSMRGPKGKTFRHDILVGFSKEDVFQQSLATSINTVTYDALAIIEFKRPQRDDYTSSDNPIEQITVYAQDIRSGNIFDCHRRRISYPEHLPIHCFIICDITPSLQRICTNRSFDRSPDGDGYFFVHSQLKLYVTIVSYQKLLTDAKRRNEAFFEKLHINGSVGYVDVPRNPFVASE